MIDLVRKNGDKIDLKKLSAELGCQAVEISALKGEGTEAAAKAAVAAAKETKAAELPHVFTGSVEHAIAHIEESIQGKVDDRFLRWYAVKLFERDDKVLAELKLDKALVDHIDEHIRDCETEMDDDAESIITNQRYAYINTVVGKAVKKKARVEHLTVSDKIDRIVTNRVLALPIFAVVMYLMYSLSMGTSIADGGWAIGTFATDWTNDVLFGEIVPNALGGFLESIGVANVKACSSTFNVPLDGYDRSGNMVGVPGDEKNTFNIMEMSGVDDNFFKMLNIPIVQGSFFTERNDSCRQVIIDERGAEKLIKTWHWKDGVVGKQITCTGHDNNIFTICGVSKNIRWGAVETGGDGMNEFPDLYFYSAKTAYYMLVKFNELRDESLSELQSKVQAMYPNNKVIVKSYASELANQYASQLNFRNGILVAGIVTMIIALFGLVGYTSDEVNRRRKEIAIRKVNGAKVKDILRIFLKDIMKIALPCIIVGDLGAWLIARQWLMSFSEKITMTPLLFIGVTIILLVIIGLSVIINCYKVANSNPVKYLKDE